MASWPWNQDIDHFLSLLPKPHFRNRDAYDVADQIGIARWRGQSIWMHLVQSGRIVRTFKPIGRSTSRCYWERSYCSIVSSDANRAHLLALTRKRV